MAALEVSHVRMTLASRAEAQSGLFAYVRLRIGPILLDGLTLRRTRGGDLRLSYPARRSRRGWLHAHVRPADERVAREVERQVLEQLGLTEVAP